MKLAWLDAHDGPPCTEADLAGAGVVYRYLSTDPAIYEPALFDLRERRGYVARDEVALATDTPDLDTITRKFIDEHLHTDDEVRFVLSGAGIFDIRSADDRWMRVEVEPGDLIVVPANRHHRFLLTDARNIRCVRLFKDRSGWAPIYRARESAS